MLYFGVRVVKNKLKGKADFWGKMENFRIICPPASDDAASGAGGQETSGCTPRAGAQPPVAARGKLHHN